MNGIIITSIICGTVLVFWGMAIFYALKSQSDENETLTWQVAELEREKCGGER